MRSPRTCSRPTCWQRCSPWPPCGSCLQCILSISSCIGICASPWKSTCVHGRSLWAQEPLWIRRCQLGGGHFKLGGKGLKALAYRYLCILKDVANRGVGDLPSCNYYRDDACSIWKTIRKFVDKILTIFYKSDEDVKGDTELQAFVDDINHALLSNPSNGFPTKLTCVAELSKFLTMVVFLCSAQHSAVNYGQFDFYAWIPNAPSAMRKLPPTTKGVVDMPFILQTLPDVQVTCISIAITWVLSCSAAKKTLGTFPDEPFQNPNALKAMQEYQSDLEVITKSIVERNKTLPIKYPYLKPDKVANNITI
ncbi:polyunsaturated fatty acid lipoxygenase ALOX12-like [Petromyzon marinus]|uniref:polyunsaturated fatty acid lipoxygenase ALOX12-like n=1 Tax=Petromyzon marinus TaxID=7757 RepID=UPI003F724F1F